MNTDNLAHIVNACLYFVMATVPYLLYMPTRLYLNTALQFWSEHSCRFWLHIMVNTKI